MGRAMNTSQTSTRTRARDLRTGQTVIWGGRPRTLAADAADRGAGLVYLITTTGETGTVEGTAEFRVVASLAPARVA